ncbi:MAG TPA: bifunctional alpha,alpha-trehalose-phosphate synthase (UDP-forming)/trehalose-phosphatase [Chthoniobacterales bacterium]
MPKRNLLILSNRLPVTVSETITKSPGGLVAALEGLSSEQFDLKWIGWPGSVIPDERKEEVERLLVEEHGCIPVFLSEEEAAGYYLGFCNSSLWPILHYMPSYMRYDPAWWEQYRQINQRFAEKALELAEPGDLVWVHDYQLMLVPQMVHDEMPELKIGFFLHTPFPSYETFRCQPKRNELVTGLLGADLIGFHTFGYMRHFRSTVLRLLGIESEITLIRNEKGHVTRLGVFPIGINAKKFEETLNSREFKQRLAEMRATDGDKRVVLSVERLDYTKGILHRIEAIERFLAEIDDPEEREAIKFIFVSVPSREGIEQYQELRAEVEARIGRINGTYATLRSSPIRFIHGSVEFVDLCALYTLSDVGLVTPLIDGMNLVAKEYIACQRDNPGVLILSEFAGAAGELFNAILINPYDAEGVANALREALALSPEEKAIRNRPMRARVMKYDAQKWARWFIEQLLRGRDEATAPARSQIDELADELRSAVRAQKHIGLFLDYDGTLREIERDPQAAKPNAGVRHLLEALRHRPNLEVTLISGRTSDDLEAWLGEYPFSLIAEHGAALRRSGTRAWERLDVGVSYAWKEPMLQILRLYEDSTPGSLVEEKKTSLVWHYRNTDPEFGAWKAHQLAVELGAVMGNEPVEIRHGRKIIEASAAAISKGAAVRRLLEGRYCDLVLCAGDDQTDESMFEIAAPNFVSIKVGRSPSRAMYRLPNPAEFRKFLESVLIAKAG